ncbi:MAG: hypothetical protein SchgKO_23250 [Schleiferiaceae bacterium]
MDSSIFLNIYEISLSPIERGQQKIYKLDFQLNVLDSLDLSHYDTPWNSFQTQIFEISTIGEDTLAALVLNRNDSTLPSGSSQLLNTTHVVLFDKDFNIIQNHSYGDFSMGFIGMGIRRLEDYIYVTGRVDSNADDTLSPFVLRLNLDGSPVDTSIISNAVNFPLNTVTVFNHIESFDNKFVVGTEDANPYGSCMAVLDKDLKFVKSVTLYPSDHGIPNLVMGNEGALKRINDSTIALLNSGFTMRSDPQEPWNDMYYHFGIAYCDTSFSNFTIDTLEFSGFNHEITGSNNPRCLIENTDVSNLDSVIIGLVGQNQTFIGTDTNQLYFYSYNLNTGTLNWQKTIERNTGSNWYVQSAYLGGGKSVFVINEYDWNTDPNLHQKVVILIMNEHGDVIGQREFTRSLTPIVLYPNPAVDRIRVKTPKELRPTSYEIISVDGRVVDSGTWDDQEISVEHLPAGKFYLKVFEEGRLVGLEGFVKN